MAGVNGVSALQVLPFGGKGRSFNFDYNLAIAGGFVAGMAKRLPPAGPFAAAPIIQGKWDGTGTPDVVSFPRGAQIGNLTGFCYANLDPYQGTISFWITPEWAGGDGLTHYVCFLSSNFFLSKHSSNSLILYCNGFNVVGPSAAAWTPGTTYHVVASWSSQRTIDGTNYGRITVNNAHVYACTTAPVPSVVPSANLNLGSSGTTLPANALIQGLVISRRVWTDSGGFGDSVGNGADEIGQVYAAGAGLDPCRVMGSWDTQASLPTDSAVGALVTSATQMWHHPIEASVPDVTMCRDGGYLGSPFAVEFNGTSSLIDCGSGATLDDVITSAGTMQVEAWVRHDGGTVAKGIASKTLYASTRGWYLSTSSAGLPSFRAYCGAGVADAAHTVDIRDGKWHHIVASHVNATHVSRVAVDGVWGAAGAAGPGAYVSDAADNFKIGYIPNIGATYWNGGIGFVRVWGAATYTPGTDFIPPHLFSSVGTAEAWAANEGTGGTLTASITAPANNGTLTNCTWSGVWAPQATPIVPTSLQCDGAATYVTCGSPVAFDDLHFAEFTVDGWYRSGASIGGIIGKGLVYSRGWTICHIGSQVIFRVEGVTTASQALIASAPDAKDNRWHYFSVHYNNAGDRKARASTDGNAVQVGASIGGLVISDAADNVELGKRVGAAQYLSGALSWIRISNNDRNAMVSGPGVKAFCPPDRVNPPAPDANTIAQWNFQDGAGLTVVESVAANNGTITMGAGKWLNTPDMAADAPGERVFNWGYKFGSSAAGDGLTIRDIGVTASQDYVVRVVTHADPRSQPYLQFWDMIGAAQIGADYFLPRRYGLHTGANNSATLICATGYFWQQLIGWRVYNITDGSWTTITAVSGDRTTITGVLAGGTDNDWDTNDYYMLMPPVGKHESQYPYATETIHVIRTPVGCTSMECRLINNSTGVIGLHQFEVQPSLLINGDHEAGAGNPFLLTGWSNNGLDAGDTEAEAAIIHAGVQSVQWNVGAAAEGMQIAATATIGSYFMMGTWHYNSPGTMLIIPVSSANALLQYSLSAYYVALTSGVYWKHTAGVWRALTLNPAMRLYASVGIADQYTDDIYAFALTPITLTVTPASAVNSAEGTGIRIDGYDRLPQPSDGSILRANSGKLTVYVTPRHNVALASGFGSVYESIVTLYQDANNYIYIRMLTNLMRLVYRANGGAVVTTDWAPGVGGWIVGTKYKVELRYNNAYVDVWVDNVRRIHVVGGVLFAAAFTNPTLWGTDDVYVNQASMVLSAS